MKVLFRTLDRLQDVKDCPAVEEGSPFIIAPLEPIPPMAMDPKYGILRRIALPNYRKYKLTEEKVMGLPVYKEVAE